MRVAELDREKKAYERRPKFEELYRNRQKTSAGTADREALVERRALFDEPAEEMTKNHLVISISARFEFGSSDFLSTSSILTSSKQ